MNTLSNGLCQLMPSRWAFEAALVLEAENRPKYSVPAKPDAAQPAGQTTANVKSDQDMAERYFPLDSDRSGTVAAVLALISMLALLAGAVVWILRLRDIH